MWNVDFGRVGWYQFKADDFKGGNLFWCDVVISPDGKLLASLGLTAAQLSLAQPAPTQDWVIGLWDTGTGKELRRLKAYPSERTMPYSIDGTRMVSSGWWTLSRMTFSPDGKVLALAGCDGAIHRWNTATGKEIVAGIAHAQHVDSLLFSPDSKTLYSSGLQEKYLEWDVSTGQARREVFAWKKYSFEEFAALSPDGTKVALVGRQLAYPPAKTIRVYDTVNAMELRTLDHPTGVWRARFSPDSDVLASQGPDGIHLWDISTGNKLHFLAKARRSDTAGRFTHPLVFAPGGQFLAYVVDSKIYLLSVATGKEVRPMGQSIWGLGRATPARYFRGQANRGLRQCPLCFALHGFDAATGKGTNTA